MLTKGNFTRDEWNHLLCLLNIRHFSSAECSEVMSKRTRKESGEERVTAKSRPMMSLIARSIERPPSALSSTASESPGKTSQESQSPLSAQAEMYDRTVKPVVCRDTSHERHRLVEKAHSSSYSGWNIDKTWSSQEWKSDELMDDRTGRPVLPSTRSSSTFRHWRRRSRIRFVVGIQIILAQGEWSSAKKTKTILNGCNRRQWKHFMVWECSCLQHCKHLYSWWRITQTIGIPSRIQKISQWNRCSTYLKNWCPNNQTRSMEWRQLTGGDSAWKHLSLIGNEQVISLQRTRRFTYFQILYCVLVR